jgi:ankyrin repeat protein
LASYYNNIDIAAYLATPDNVPFDVNQGTVNGYTPLCIAVIRQNAEII